MENELINRLIFIHKLHIETHNLRSYSLEFVYLQKQHPTPQIQRIGLYISKCMYTYIKND